MIIYYRIMEKKKERKITKKIDSPLHLCQQNDQNLAQCSHDPNWWRPLELSASLKNWMLPSFKLCVSVQDLLYTQST